VSFPLLRESYILLLNIIFLYSFVEGKSMALINCPECNKEISDTSPACIGCGYQIKQPTTIQDIRNEKVKEKSSGSSALSIIIGIVVFILVFVYFPTSCIPTGCATTTTTRSVQCSGLRVAQRYVDGLSGEFNTREFRNSYWHGFWAVHADCTICLRNGDVPARYR